MLKDDGVRTFRGVYAVGRGGACEKIHGRGPARFAEADVATFLKFNSARRPAAVDLLAGAAAVSYTHLTLPTICSV